MKLLLTCALLIFSSSVSAQVINPEVTQDTINSTICSSGWTSKVRPPVKYINAVKRRLLTKRGISLDESSKYRVDHIVPLNLGGSSLDLKNMQLQKWDHPNGARVKDIREQTAYTAVCSGKIKLDKARACFLKDWHTCPIN